MGTLFYAGDSISFLNLRFENDVKMYGTQTLWNLMTTAFGFENDVKMYSTQTFSGQILLNRTFENDVKFIFVNNKNR